MSEQEENNGAEEEVGAQELAEMDAAERGDVDNEGTDTDALEVTLLGKITWEDGDQGGEIISFVASEGAEWVQEPPKEIKNGETGEFDIKATITDGDELTVSIEMAGDIKLFFDVNGEENAVHSTQMIGPTITGEISPGAHAVAHFTIAR